jgi:hypothetical protein
MSQILYKSVPDYVKGPLRGYAKICTNRYRSWQGRVVKRQKLLVELHVESHRYSCPKVERDHQIAC